MKAWTITAALLSGFAFFILAGGMQWVQSTLRQKETVTVSSAGGGAWQLEIVTLLGRDGIPAILNPQFVQGDVAEQMYEPDEPVLGISIDGDHRAYSIPFLSSHEIVNDTVGGKHVAITW